MSMRTKKKLRTMKFHFSSQLFDLDISTVNTFFFRERFVVANISHRENVSGIYVSDIYT